MKILKIHLFISIYKVWFYEIECKRSYLKQMIIWQVKYYDRFSQRLLRNQEKYLMSFFFRIELSQFVLSGLRNPIWNNLRLRKLNCASEIKECLSRCVMSLWCISSSSDLENTGKIEMGLEFFMFSLSPPLCKTQLCDAFIFRGKTACLKYEVIYI